MVLNMNAMQAADLAIAVAYFFIPIEIFLYVFKSRYRYSLTRRTLLVSILSIAFILACGTTHLLSVLHAPMPLILGVKILTAAVSIAASVVLCWVVPEALSLPQYVSDITVENKLMRDFKAVTNTIRRVLEEDAIVENAETKLRRLLPPNTLVCISKEPPAELFGKRELLTLPVSGALCMHLRRSNLTEAQVTWLHDVCVQMKLALEQARAIHTPKPLTSVAGRVWSVASTSEASSQPTGESVPFFPTHVASSSTAPPDDAPDMLRLESMRAASVQSEPPGVTAYERLVDMERSLNTLRVRCSRAFSRVQAAAEVLESASLTPEQQKCISIILDACRDDVLVGQ